MSLSSFTTKCTHVCPREVLVEMLVSQTYQHTRSNNSSQVEDFICDVVTVISHFTSGEKQQNVTEETQDGQR